MKWWICLWMTMLFISSKPVLTDSFWLSKDVAREVISEWKENEGKRGEKLGRGHDRRSSTPFVSGDGFRELCDPHICEDTNRCRMNPEAVTNGSCIFIKSDMFDMFVTHVAPRVKGTYVLVSHNGDLSAPDGQTDARLGMGRHEALPRMMDEFHAGRLLAFHGQNLWWKNFTVGEPRPHFLHCLPIGIECRQWKVGANPGVYADALQRYIVDAPERSLEQMSKRPMLLVAFYPKGRAPDRLKVLSAIGALQSPPPQKPWYNKTDLNHAEWLEAIGLHRFVLAPFGHGLDTHRVYEIMLMGGIPVMRRSSISSCFDDSDNRMGPNPNTPSRRSLPVVILDRWEDLNATRLEAEWRRLTRAPIDRWDYSRLLMKHWTTRIKNLAHN